MSVQGVSGTFTSVQLLSGSNRSIFRAILSPFDPRFFEKISPSWLIMKLITPLSP